MDRVTRKANLRKLQLPGTGNKTTHQRNTRQNTNSQVNSITKHFLNTESPLKKDESNTVASPSSNGIAIPKENSYKNNKEKSPCTKRTKLDGFVFKTPQSIKPPENKNNNDDDFDALEKKTKKAPIISEKEKKVSGKIKKAPRKKKQTTIKSAFLRNEQLFAEIAAQHCAADNFNADDIQLAIAISKSEVESRGIVNTNTNDDNIDIVVDNVVEAVNDEEKAEQIRQKLERYGFRTAEQKDYQTFATAFMPHQGKSRRVKSKWANKFTALTLRDEQQQHKKLQQKIETFLKQQFRTKPLTVEEEIFPKLYLQSFLLQKCDKDTKTKLINLAKKSEIASEAYYVSELFTISKLPAGHLLKDWKAIQGRDLTPQKNDKFLKDKESRLNEIYQELEDYYLKLKNGCSLYESLKEEDRKQRESEEKKQEINTPKNENNDLSLNPLASSASPLPESLRKLLPSTKYLDLMQVSNCTLKIESSQEYNIKQPHDNDEEPMETSISSNEVPLSEKNATIKIIENSCNKIDLTNSNGTDNTNKTKDSKTIIDFKSATSQSNIMDLSCYSLGEEHFVDSNENSRQIVDIEIEESKENSFKRRNKHKEFESSRGNNNITETRALTSFPSDNTNDISQKNRSNSPDLFADSDVEMEDEECESTLKLKDEKRNCCNILTTYEIYSSDEVKNSPSLGNHNLSAFQPKGQIENVIDLTQDSCERVIPPKVHNQSIPIVEIDIFADSPQSTNAEEDTIKDINSKSQQSLNCIPTVDNETFKFTLSPQEVANKSPFKGKIVLEENIYHCDEANDEDVLNDMQMNQTELSFLNFQDSKQKETSFHRQTANEMRKTTSLKSPSPQPTLSLPGNETIFHELYNKYLGRKSKSIDCNAEKSVLRKSFTQMEVSPKKMEHVGTQFTMDLNINRKSLSFTFKTPQKLRNLSSGNIMKSRSFNAENLSIDLAQNEDNEEEEVMMGNDKDDIADDGDVDDDDECLILSDDEINYSIWNADKIDDFEGDKMYSKVSKDKAEKSSVTKFSETEQQMYSDFENHDSIFKKSMIDLSFSPRSNDKSLGHMKNSCNSPDPNDIPNQFDRSNFGIMEDFSQPTFEYTPLEDNISFLFSPSEQPLSMKTIPRSCRKSTTTPLNELIHEIQNDSPAYKITNDYEEFQMDIENEQKNISKNKSITEVPQGLEQLLLGDISFEVPSEMKKNKKIKKSFSNGSDHFESKPKDHILSVSCDSQQLIINNKTYTIRNCSETKPDYINYSEAELLKELYNFGIKPLKRKQAIKMLEYIYIQTHPIMMDDDDHDDEPSIELSEEEKEVYRSLEHLNENDTNIPESISKNIEKSTKNKLNLHDACGSEMLRFSMDLKADLPDEQYILQTNVTKKTPQPLMPLHIAWYNLVCSNPQLHEMILMYEPIDLQEVYLFLKNLGYRYDPKDLKQFLDRRCIIFRYDLAAAGSGTTKSYGSNRHIRKMKNIIKKK